MGGGERSELAVLLGDVCVCARRESLVTVPSRRPREPSTWLGAPPRGRRARAVVTLCFVLLFCNNFIFGAKGRFRDFKLEGFWQGEFQDFKFLDFKLEEFWRRVSRFQA